MKIVHFHPAAEAELIAAAAYYEAQQSDLGRRFLAAVQAAVNRISLNPRLYPVVEPESSDASRRPFPSASFFAKLPDGLSSWR